MVCSRPDFSDKRLTFDGLVWQGLGWLLHPIDSECIRLGDWFLETTAVTFEMPDAPFPALTSASDRSSVGAGYNPEKVLN